MSAHLTGALAIALCLGLGGAAQAKSPFTLATMPRIDVHTHIRNDWKTLDEIKEECKMRGLALPLDVLEKIYFRNAMRVYPHVADALAQLGYFGKDGAKNQSPP